MFLSDSGSPDKEVPGFAAGLSSNSILTAGEISSRNWPFLTLQIKATKKSAATDMLAINNKMITLIGSFF